MKVHSFRQSSLLEWNVDIVIHFGKHTCNAILGRDQKPIIISNVSNHISAANGSLLPLNNCIKTIPVSTRTRATLTICIFIFQGCVMLTKCLSGNACFGVHKEGEFYYGCPIKDIHIIKLSLNWLYNATKNAAKNINDDDNFVSDYTFFRNSWK